MERREQDERPEQAAECSDEAHALIVVHGFAPFVSSTYGNR
jgi:hypothetical protein